MNTDAIHYRHTANSAEQQLAEIMASAMSIADNYNPDAALKTSDFEDHTDRTLYVKLEGSLEDFAEGNVKPVWYVDEGCEHVYQRIAGYDDQGKAVYAGDVGKTILFDMVLEKLESTFPVDIGAIIPHIEGREYTSNGRNYAFIATAHCRDAPNRTIYEPKSSVSRSALEKFQNNSTDSIRADIFENTERTHAFVSNDNPVAHMLRENQKDLGIHLELEEGEQGWMKVASPLVEACIKRYDEDLRINFVDMRDFKVMFERVDAPGDWTQNEGLVDNVRSRARGKGGHVASQRKTNKYALKAKVNAKLVCVGK